MKLTATKKNEKKVTLLAETTQGSLDDIVVGDKERQDGARTKTNGGVISGPSNNNFQNNINNSIILLAQPSSHGSAPVTREEPPQASMNPLLMLEHLNNMKFGD